MPDRPSLCASWTGWCTEIQSHGGDGQPAAAVAGGIVDAIMLVTTNRPAESPARRWTPGGVLRRAALRCGPDRRRSPGMDLPAPGDSRSRATRRSRPSSPTSVPIPAGGASDIAAAVQVQAARGPPDAGLRQPTIRDAARPARLRAGDRRDPHARRTALKLGAGLRGGAPKLGRLAYHPSGVANSRAAHDSLRDLRECSWRVARTIGRNLREWRERFYRSAKQPSLAGE